MVSHTQVPHRPGKKTAVTEGEKETGKLIVNKESSAELLPGKKKGL